MKTKKPSRAADKLDGVVGSDTPRTDEVCRHDVFGGAEWRDMVRHAKQLERELDAATLELAHLRGLSDWAKVLLHCMREAIEEAGPYYDDPRCPPRGKEMIARWRKAAGMDTANNKVSGPESAAKGMP